MQSELRLPAKMRPSGSKDATGRLERCMSPTEHINHLENPKHNSIPQC